MRWQRVGRNAFPGLNRVCFVTPRLGFVVGDGSDQYPSGIFSTDDAGLHWRPMPGPQCPGWLGADFLDVNTAAFSGAWSRLGTLRGNQVGLTEVDTLGGRMLCALQFLDRNC